MGRVRKRGGLGPDPGPGLTVRPGPLLRHPDRVVEWTMRNQPGSGRRRDRVHLVSTVVNVIRCEGLTKRFRFVGSGPHPARTAGLGMIATSALAAGIARWRLSADVTV